MMARRAAFAIPGDITTLTGGYIYERRLLEGLRHQGWDVQHIELADSFPMPSGTDMAASVAALAEVDPTRPLILDGLVFGAIDTDGLATVGAPIVAMIHHPLALESGLSPALRDHLFRTERDNLRIAAHVLVPSPHTRSILIERYEVSSGKIAIVRPGVAKPRIRSKPVEPPLILSVGIQHPRKGHDILVAALERLRHIDWTAVIVGSAWDPAYADELALQAANFGLGPRLRFEGRVEDAKLEELYRTAGIFALATRYEGYGIVFDEALAYGLPIVSCRTGAVPDTVPSDAGLLVPTDDSAAFADALADLLENRDRRKALADAAKRAGARLPGWNETARIAGTVLDRVAAEMGATHFR